MKIPGPPSGFSLDGMASGESIKLLMNFRVSFGLESLGAIWTSMASTTGFGNGVILLIRSAGRR